MIQNKNVAAAIVATTSASLILVALIFQALGYVPCEMCMWQRWAHAIAGALATIAILLPRRLGICAAMASVAAITCSGAVGVFHAGVEWKLWNGITMCAARFNPGDGDVLTQIIRSPLVRCDEAAWRFLGLSMAGYNALASFAAAFLSVCVLMFGWRGSISRKKENTQ